MTRTAVEVEVTSSDPVGPSPTGAQLLASRPAFRRIGLVAVWSATVVIHVMLIAQAFTQSPVDVDEGFNLSVVRNLVNGVGYMSDGILTPYAYMPFEPGLSTGPTLILPAAGLHAMGLGIFVAGRLVGVIYYVGLLVLLAALGRRIAGNWGALAAVASPLFLDLFTNDHSPLYGPGDLLGEYAAAALLVGSLLCVRGRPRLAGLMVGLAMLTKLAAVAALPIVLVGAWINAGAMKPMERLRAVAPTLGVALLPLFAWEIVKVSFLGARGYVELLQASLDGATRERVEYFQLDEKTATLITSWFVPAPVVLIVAITLVALLTAIVARRFSSVPTPNRLLSGSESSQLVIAGWGIAAAFVALWFVNRNTDAAWIRHPSPGLLVGIAVTCAGAVAITRHLMRGRVSSSRRLGALAAAGLGACAIASAVSHEVIASDAQRLVSIEHQEEYAQAIADTGAPAVQVLWGPAVPLAVLADVPARSLYLGLDPDLPLVLDNYERAHLAAYGRYLASELCGERIVDKQAIICWPADGAVERWEALMAAPSWALEG